MALPFPVKSDEILVELAKHAKDIGLSIVPGKTQRRIIVAGEDGLRVLDETQKETELDYLGLILDSKGVRVRQKTLTKFGHRVSRVSHLVQDKKISVRKALEITRTRMGDANYLIRVERKLKRKFSRLNIALKHNRVFQRARQKVVRYKTLKK